jgi:hypothetical protein
VVVHVKLTLLPESLGRPMRSVATDVEHSYALRILDEYQDLHAIFWNLSYEMHARKPAAYAFGFSIMGK